MPNYQTQVDAELDKAIQAQALALYSRGQLKDEDDKPIEVKIGPSGKHVSHYSLTRLALWMFANGSKAPKDRMREPIAESMVKEPKIV